MTSSAFADDRFWQLIDASCNRRLEPNELSELDVALHGAPARLRLYRDLCRLHTDLHLTISAQQVMETVQVRIRSASSLPNAVTQLGSWATQNTWAFTLAVAVAFYGGIGLLVWSMSQPTSLDQYATRGSTPGLTQSVVEKIVESTPCVWEPGAGPHDSANNATLERQYRLVTGTAEITFQQGAHVILEGPAIFEVQTGNASYLHRGKLIAHVPRKAKGFTVQTPSACVVDLGTKFSIEVDPNGVVDVQVLQGTVEVTGDIPAKKSGSSSNVVQLREGESVRIAEGSVGPIQPTVSATHPPQRSSETKVSAIDLVDILAGGDGSGQRRNRGINPATGEIVLPPTNDYSRFDYFSNSTKYLRVSDSPFIDGVAIPDGGAGAMVLDSAGHTFAEFPDTDGTSYGPIWAGGVLPQPDPDSKLRTTFDGKIDYAVAPHGFMALIPNKLITFDLKAIRLAHPGKALSKFRAAVGMTKPLDRKEEGLGDAWVFVDGKVRFSRVGIKARHGAQVVDVPLGKSDRFLTLVATDGGDTPHFDWIIFADPRIELAADDQQNTRQSTSANNQ